MFRSLRELPHARASSSGSIAARRRVGLGGLLALSIAAVAMLGGSAGAATTCNRSATTATFSSEVSAATAGQTICLASGNYGTWSGTNKAITVAAASGASPQMKVSFGSGDSGFTLDGMTGMGGNIGSGARDITIRNSAFTSTIDVNGNKSNIVLDHNTHDWNVGPSSGGANAKIFVWSSPSGVDSGVTVRNSHIANGDLDGVHIGASAGMNILSNVFDNLCDKGANHTDNIQTEGMNGGRIAGNLVHAGAGCASQGITSYDSGTVGVVIEDNVVDIRRPWGIEWYSDRSSIIRHNTIRWYADADCDFGGIQCGQIDINRKSADPAGSGTQVYDNLATSVNFTNGSSGTQSRNVSSQQAKYVGPTTTWAGFKLAGDSPVGLRAASDGLDAGVRVGTASSPTTPTPPTPPPSSDTPADAIWTAPSGARVGTAVTLDGTGSKGDAPIACTWSFEDQGGATIWETQTGCKLQKTFRYTGTKYVKLIVRDADGDTDSNKQSFSVR